MSDGDADLTAAALSALVALGVDPQAAPRRLTAVFNALRSGGVPLPRSSHADCPGDLCAVLTKAAAGATSSS